MTDSLKVLIVGLGSMGAKHLSVVRSLFPDSRIMVLRHHPVDDLPFGANYVTSSFSDVVHFQPFISIISNPSSYHLETAFKLVDLKSHLLIEKPVSNSIDNVLELIQLCQSCGLACVVGYNLRFLPSLKYFRELISSGSYGKLLFVDIQAGQYLPSWRPLSSYNSTVSSNQSLGGGVLLELSHELDYLLWLFGMPKWVVAFTTKTFFFDIDVEDYAHMTFGISCDSTKKDIPINVSLDFARLDPVRSCHVCCSEGSLNLDLISGKIKIYDPKISLWSEVYNSNFPMIGTYENQFLNLVESIECNQLDYKSSYDALRVLHLVEASRVSSQLNSTRTSIS